MAFEGDVATFPVGDLLAWLAQRRATGVLSLTRRLTARRFHLRGGQVRLVSSSEQEMLLGQLLVERADHEFDAPAVYRIELKGNRRAIEMQAEHRQLIAAGCARCKRAEEGAKFRAP